MKTLGTLKLAAVSALIILGMSSCLKSEDPDFAIGTQSPYILQEGTGAGARFMPVIQLVGNRAIKSATCQFDGKTYRFSAVEGNPYYMELEPSYQFSMDTVMNWNCTISATSAEETPATTQVSFTFPSSAKLGAFNVTELKYTGNSNKVEGKWNKVANASQYCLMIKFQNSEIFVPYREITVTGENELTGSINLPLEKDQTYTIAIGVMNKSLISIAGKLTVTGGTDKVFNGGNAPE